MNSHEPLPLPKPDPRRALISEWGTWIAKRGDKLYPSDWGAMMNILYHRFEKADEKTGEIFVLYPSIEEWRDKLEAWFTNSDFAKECNYKFVAFLAEKVYVDLKPKRKVRFKKYCHKCFQDHYNDEDCPNVEKVSGIAPIHQLVSTLSEQKTVVPNPYKCNKCNKTHSPNFNCETTS